ncbi:hypothetical protein [Streptomyces sp. NRRL S-337]|uniref:hypothetical protein n=1 Tax=Streptomyces sp. NRRL S-337 TaxID=1463900 RepID=UPI00131D964A|nr:hypothetical protein [Streptomyces sp. NRRL S-337]
MSAAFALPGPVRLSRTVAVRRALVAGLFLVGFAVLGFAFGPGAHADDRAGSPTPSGTTSPAQKQTHTRAHMQAPTHTQTRTQASTARERTTADRTATDRTATDRSAGTTDRTAADRTSTDRSPADRTPYRAATRYGAAERVDQECWAHRSAGSGTAVEQEGATAGARVTEPTDTAGNELAYAVRPAAEQTGPVTRPVTGAVGEIGDAFGGALPVQLPSVEHPGRPGHGGGLPHGDGVTGGGVTGGDRPSHARIAAPAGGFAVVPPAHCIQGEAQQAAPDLPSAVSGQRDADRPGLPEQQLPQGPTAPAPHSAGDQQGPRGGDQHAAAPADTPRFRLLPGGVRTADGAPTRRRAEEILEFPG